MKAQLLFDLSDNDEKIEHQRCLKATQLACALFDIEQIIRNKMKYGELSDDAYKALESIQNSAGNVLDNYSINLDELLQ